MNEGDMVPSCAYQATNDLCGQLADYRGQWLILYFYPKDATPGCTQEGQDFRDFHDAFRSSNAVILGVSRDSLSSHERFKSKHNFPFELISDVDETLCRVFDVIKLKSMYGKQVMGIERSTFLIDPEGRVRRTWRKVKVSGHAHEVKDTLTSLQEHENLE